MVPTVVFVYGFGHEHPMAVGALGIVAYVAILWALNTFSEEEVRFWKRAVQQYVPLVRS